MSFDPSRHVGRNIRPPCARCKPDLTFENTTGSTDNNLPDTNHSLDKLSLFFSDPASHPATTQSPPRSPTPFPLLLSAPQAETRGFIMTIHTPTIFSPALTDRFGRVIFGFGTQKKTTRPFSASVVFGNGINNFVDLTNFNSGNNMYFQMPSFFPCLPSNFNMQLTSKFASGSKSNCINSPLSSLQIENLQTLGTVKTFGVVQNVIKNEDACPTFVLVFSWN